MHQLSAQVHSMSPHFIQNIGNDQAINHDTTQQRMHETTIQFVNDEQRSLPIQQEIHYIKNDDSCDNGSLTNAANRSNEIVEENSQFLIDQNDLLDEKQLLPNRVAYVLSGFNNFISNGDMAQSSVSMQQVFMDPNIRNQSIYIIQFFFFLVIGNVKGNIY